MESENLTEKQLKKKEANIRYREKMKKKLEEAETVSKSASQHEEADEKPPEIEDIEETIEVEDEEEKFVLDKKAYLYLLEKAKLGESITEKVEEKPQKDKPKEQEKKPESTEPTFFQLVGNSFKTTAVSLIPVITLQAMIHGGRLLTNSTNNSRSNNIMNQPNKQPSKSTGEFNLPSVNAL